MDDLVREWVEKAEADVRTAEREAVVTKGPSWDAVCFHAQQAVEKYLKALLQHRSIGFTRTHDLAVLLRQADERWGSSDSLGSPWSGYRRTPLRCAILVSARPRKQPNGW